jgi:hypothetical protein
MSGVSADSGRLSHLTTAVDDKDAFSRSAVLAAREVYFKLSKHIPTMEDLSKLGRFVPQVFLNLSSF